VNDETTHAVFATTHQHERVRVSDALGWREAQREWQRLDLLRLAGLMPHVKHLEVRSTDDPGYISARLSFLHRRPVLKGSRGYADSKGSGWGNEYTGKEKAARKAWSLFAPTFRASWDKDRDKFRRSQGKAPLMERTGVQGSGGWYYWPNGTTAAQGLSSLATLCERRGLIVQGLNDKWFALDLSEPEGV